MVRAMKNSGGRSTSQRPNRPFPSDSHRNPESGLDGNIDREEMRAWQKIGAGGQRRWPGQRWSIARRRRQFDIDGESKGERNGELPPNPGPSPILCVCGRRAGHPGAKPGIPATIGQIAQSQGPDVRPLEVLDGSFCSKIVPGPRCPAEEPDVRQLDREPKQRKDFVRDN